MERSSSTKVLMVIAGALLIIVGIMTLRYPIATLISMALFLGIAILFVGIMHTASYFTNRKFLPKPGWLLVEGILEILIGLMLLFNIGITTASLPFVLGFWALFAGISRFAISLDIKKVGFKNWWVMMLTGVLSIILGILVMVFPAFGAAFIASFVSVFMIYYGIMIIVEAFAVKSAKK